MLKKVQDGVDAIKRDVTDSGLHRSPSWWHIIIVRIFIIIAVITIITAITRYDLGRLITSLSSPTAITASSPAQSCPQVQPIKQINRRNNQTNRTINKQTKQTNKQKEQNQFSKKWKGIGKQRKHVWSSSLLRSPTDLTFQLLITLEQVYLQMWILEVRNQTNPKKMRNWGNAPLAILKSISSICCRKTEKYLSH